MQITVSSLPFVGVYNNLMLKMFPYMELRRSVHGTPPGIDQFFGTNRALQVEKGIVCIETMP